MNQINEDLLLNGAATLRISLNENEVKLYQKYMDILLEWNNRVNLTAIKEPDEIIVKHFLDSMAVLPFLQQYQCKSLLDIGTGAGFPGVPIKIADKGIDVVLLDSLNKRVAFLNHLIAELKLEKICALHGRAEDFGHDEKYRARFEVVVSRAVAKLSVLAELCLPFVKVGGVFIAYKGPKAEEEVQEADKALALLGGKVDKIVKVILPGSVDERFLVFVKKENETSGKYPRKAGIPEKRPL